MRSAGDSSIRGIMSMGDTREASLLLSGTTTTPPKSRLFLDLAKTVCQSPPSSTLPPLLLGY